MVSMGEALEALSSHTPKGSDWPYILVQSYKGANHMPLPKDGHVCVLPQGEVGNLSGWISQTKICQLLSTRPSVVFPMELNQGNQSVTTDLPESLHMGSSVINDEYPYIEVNIPTLVPEEQDNANLPLGKKCNTATADQPKTSWKPRITLTAEVKDLISQGMTDDYDWSQNILPRQKYLPQRQLPRLPRRGKSQFCYWIPILKQVQQRQKLPGKATLPALCPWQWSIAATVAAL